MRQLIGEEWNAQKCRKKKDEYFWIQEVDFDNYNMKIRFRNIDNSSKHAV